VALIPNDTRDNGSQDPSQSDFNLDADGYPMSMQGENAAAGKTFTEIDALFNNALPYLYYPAGQYILLYDGQGTFAFQGDATEDLASSTAGRIVLNDFSPSTNGIRVEITSTDPSHTGDYINNIRLVYAPYESLLDSGEIFNPAFVNVIKPFSLVRFMGWDNTNYATSYNGTADPTVVNSGNWSDRDTSPFVFWGHRCAATRCAGQKTGPQRMGAEVGRLKPDPFGIGLHEVADRLVGEPCGAEPAALRDGPE
jgi:hypothetical protein